MQLPRPLMIAITILITIAWAANVVVGFLTPDRHDPTLNAIFAVVVGAVYALSAKDSETVKAARRRLARIVAGDDRPLPPPPEHKEHQGGEK